MERTKWLVPTLYLCTFGFLKELKPYESFLTPYLNSEHKNFTRREITNTIYPVATYSYFSFLILVFLLCPLVIITGGTTCSPLYMLCCMTAHCINWATTDNVCCPHHAQTSTCFALLNRSKLAIPVRIIEMTEIKNARRHPCVNVTSIHQ